MSFVVCIKPFGDYLPGEIVEVPDGAEVSSLYFEPAPQSDIVPPVSGSSS